MFRLIGRLDFKSCDAVGVIYPSRRASRWLFHYEKREPLPIAIGLAIRPQFYFCKEDKKFVLEFDAKISNSLVAADGLHTLVLEPNRERMVWVEPHGNGYLKNAGTFQEFLEFYNSGDFLERSEAWKKELKHGLNYWLYLNRR